MHEFEKIEYLNSGSLKNSSFCSNCQLSTFTKVPYLNAPLKLFVSGEVIDLVAYFFKKINVSEVAYCN